jgi:hypothetical protein
MAGSKTVGAVRERLRQAKKKGEGLIEGSASTPTTTAKKTKKVTAPTGGVDKKSLTKVKAGARKATNPKVKSEEHVNEEEEDDEGI